MYSQARMDRKDRTEVKIGSATIKRPASKLAILIRKELRDKVVSSMVGDVVNGMRNELLVLLEK